MDLTPFCGTDETRPQITKPFSRGEFTYATNGHLCIRVPRREDATEQDEVNVLNLPWDKPHYYVPFPDIAMPPKVTRTEKCSCFDGYEHDCPDCACEECDGTGTATIDSDAKTSVGLCGTPYALRLVRMIADLPGLQIAAGRSLKHDRSSVLAFRFDGGDGLLMPPRHCLENHLVEPCPAEEEPGAAPADVDTDPHALSELDKLLEAARVNAGDSKAGDITP
jgi:hypothetical protein